LIEITVEDSADIARIPAPASLAAATDPLGSTSAGGLITDPPSSDPAPTSSSGSPSPLLIVAALLALAAAALIGFAAAGPERRARLVTTVRATATTLRARLVHAPQAGDQG
jgi:hypothetical protein